MRKILLFVLGYQILTSLLSKNLTETRAVTKPSSSSAAPSRSNLFFIQGGRGGGESSATMTSSSLKSKRHGKPLSGNLKFLLHNFRKRRKQEDDILTLNDSSGDTWYALRLQKKSLPKIHSLFHRLRIKKNTQHGLPSKNILLVTDRSRTPWLFLRKLPRAVLSSPTTARRIPLGRLPRKVGLKSSELSGRFCLPSSSTTTPLTPSPRSPSFSSGCPSLLNLNDLFTDEKKIPETNMDPRWNLSSSSAEPVSCGNTTEAVLTPQSTSSSSVMVQETFLFPVTTPAGGSSNQGYQQELQKNGNPMTVVLELHLPTPTGIPPAVAEQLKSLENSFDNLKLSYEAAMSSLLTKTPSSGVETSSSISRVPCSVTTSHNGVTTCPPLTTTATTTTTTAAVATSPQFTHHQVPPDTITSMGHQIPLLNPPEITTSFRYSTQPSYPVTNAASSEILLRNPLQDVRGVFSMPVLPYYSIPKIPVLQGSNLNTQNVGSASSVGVGQPPGAAYVPWKPQDQLLQEHPHGAPGGAFQALQNEHKCFSGGALEIATLKPLQNDGIMVLPPQKPALVKSALEIPSPSSSPAVSTSLFSWDPPLLKGILSEPPRQAYKATRLESVEQTWGPLLTQASVTAASVLTTSYDNSSGVIQRIIAAVEDIKNEKKGKCLAEGMPCNIVGSWSSSAGGMLLNITNDTSGFREVVLSPKSPPTKGFLADPGWTLRASSPFSNSSSSSSMVILTGTKESSKNMAAFLGECRVCDGIEIVSGNWLITRMSRNCMDRGAYSRFMSDVWRREMLSSLKNERLKELKGVSSNLIRTKKSTKSVEGNLGLDGNSIGTVIDTITVSQTTKSHGFFYNLFQKKRSKTTRVSKTTRNSLKTTRGTKTTEEKKTTRETKTTEERKTTQGTKITQETASTQETKMTQKTKTTQSTTESKKTTITSTERQSSTSSTIQTTKRKKKWNLKKNLKKIFHLPWKSRKHNATNAT